ncbi:MAG: four helix bundle protein, partial [Acidobacteria bacterium]|nr:four helix bundle protein [Acidobacteriota bacterium]
ANIAEGHGREHLRDYLHHLSVANGSLMELETHLLIASRLSYVEQSELDRAFFTRRRGRPHA